MRGSRNSPQIIHYIVGIWQKRSNFAVNWPFSPKNQEKITRKMRQRPIEIVKLRQEFGSFRGDWGNSRDGHHLRDRELCLVSLSLPQSGFRTGRAGSGIRHWLQESAAPRPNLKGKARDLPESRLEGRTAESRFRGICSGKHR